MSARRAAIRRERKEREKASKMQGTKGKLERAKEQGRLDGRTVASCIVLEQLHDKYKFSKNKVNDFLMCINDSASKWDNEVNQYVLNFWASKFVKKINKADIDQQQTTIEKQVYMHSFDQYFISASAVMMLVLNSEYNFQSFQNKETGRLDHLMKCLIDGYDFMVNENKDAEYFYKRMKEKTGYDI